MENKEKIEAVQRMQDYIMQHLSDDISLEALANAAVYSPWQALRAFSELTGKTPFAYIRDVRLSEAAKKLRDSSESVLDIALSAAFGSHEGFTKAFSRKFGLSPAQYRKTAPPIPLFTYYPVRISHNLPIEGGNIMDTSIVFTQVIDRPARKLILMRGVKAEDYFEYCEEVSCDVWGMLDSIRGALYEPIGVWLPEHLRKPGTSEYCQGVEVTEDFTGTVPDGFDIIDLPACKYMIFHGEPFADEQYSDAIGIVWNAIEKYDPKRYGWEFSPEDGPRFQLEPQGARGYIEGLPVREIK